MGALIEEVGVMMDSPRARVHEGFRRLAIIMGAVLGFVLGGIVLLIKHEGISWSYVIGVGVSVGLIVFLISWGAVCLVGWIIEGFFGENQKNLQAEPGSIIISSDVDSKEFSRVFAEALLDKAVGKILPGLLEASGNNVTSREMAILKYLLGKEDNEFLMQTITQKRVSYQESWIISRQMELLKSVMGSEEFRIQQEERRKIPEDLGRIE